MAGRTWSNSIFQSHPESESNVLYDLFSCGSSHSVRYLASATISPVSRDNIPGSASMLVKALIGFHMGFGFQSCSTGVRAP